MRKRRLLLAGKVDEPTVRHRAACEPSPSPTLQAIKQEATPWVALQLRCGGAPRYEDDALLSRAGRGRGFSVGGSSLPKIEKKPIL